MASPKAHNWIMNLAPYVPGKANAEGVKNPVKMSANESAFGPSPDAVAAIKASADKIRLYPDPAAKGLVEAIAENFNLHADNILCGTGSDDPLTLLIHSYTGPGDEVIFSKYGFSFYGIQAQAAGATGVAVKNKNWAADVDGILAAVNDKTKMVLLDNPNNPTGAYNPWPDVERLHNALPESVLLVLDAAYAESATASDYKAGEELVDRADNVVMTRTFSKLYGLAGIRVGWMYGPTAVVDVLNRWRNPFNVSIPAHDAALAAVKDQTYLDEVVSKTARWREWLTAEFEGLGLEVVKSQANFVLVGFPKESVFSAEKCYEYLMKHGYIVRKFGVLPNHLRITVGTKEQNMTLVSLVREFMNGSSGEAKA